MTQVICADEKIAIELLAVYEKDVDLGDKILVRLAMRGLCQRAMFTVMARQDLQLIEDELSLCFKRIANT